MLTEGSVIQSGFPFGIANVKVALYIVTPYKKSNFAILIRGSHSLQLHIVANFPSKLTSGTLIHCNSYRS